jgi:hypothetical protein
LPDRYRSKQGALMTRKIDMVTGFPACHRYPCGGLAQATFAGGTFRASPARYIAGQHNLESCKEKASGREITQTEALALLEDSGAGSDTSYLIGGA